MQINRGTLLAAAMVVGSVIVTGCNGSTDASSENAQPAQQTEQTTASAAEAATTAYGRFDHRREVRERERRFEARREQARFARRPWWGRLAWWRR